uniref:RRM domain-containing protein n=2 Tax=Lactuca sativa TaxID=4236 RepID=A0A9R1WG50_LACSA|nr:hypothetical protein LSAT_V11C200055740 [Lactuca sativa]
MNLMASTLKKSLATILFVLAFLCKTMVPINLAVVIDKCIKDCMAVKVNCGTECKAAGYQTGILVVTTMADQEGWNQVRRRKKYGREFDINGKAVTFYVQNFPSDWSEAALWRMFSRYGAVVDVYIAQKLNRSNKIFGFVRFLRIHDPKSFEKRLNEIIIGTQKIEVNVARFERKEQVSRRENHQALRGQHAVQTSQPQPYVKSFADAVRGPLPIDTMGAGKSSKADEEAHTRKTIKLISFHDSKEAMENTLVGEVESFQALMNVKAF